MTHTHTLGTRFGHGMAAGASGWDAIGVLNTKRTTGTIVSSRTQAASAAENRSTTTGHRFARPSFLRIDLEDLHRGTFNEMNARIDALPKDSTLVDLYERLLANTEKVHGAVVADVIGLLWASRRGLSIPELTAIVGCCREDMEDLCSALSSHLIKRNGLLTFAHNDFRTAAENRYVTASNRIHLHSRIARHFAQAPVTLRRVDELPWQYAVCGAWSELKETIVDPATAAMMIDSSDGRADLAGYWKSLEDRYDVVVEYIAALDRASRSDSSSRIKEMAASIVRFVAEIGRVDGVDAIRSRGERSNRRAISLHHAPAMLGRRVHGRGLGQILPMSGIIAIG